MTEADHVSIPVTESEIERFPPVETEMSDEVVVRGCGYQDERSKRLYVLLGAVSSRARARRLAPPSPHSAARLLVHISNMLGEGLAAE